MSSRYSSQAHQRDTRTQLFGNQTPTYANPNASSRSSTPGSRYSESAMSQLESQNEDQMEGLSAKIKMLKDVSVEIGDRVRSDNNLLNDMEETFGSAGQKLKGTFNRMMRMAERSGVGWRAWLGLFAVIFLFFFYVWWR